MEKKYLTVRRFRKKPPTLLTISRDPNSRSLLCVSVAVSFMVLAGDGGLEGGRRLRVRRWEEVKSEEVEGGGGLDARSRRRVRIHVFTLHL